MFFPFAKKKFSFNENDFSKAMFEVDQELIKGNRTKSKNSFCFIKTTRKITRTFDCADSAQVLQ